ncbi:TGFB1-induced anti-apoptotic factor 1 [Manis javanica]|nr:TGFB1-induced anti-apoptotic factor 1 [Manis javanica]
MLLGPWGGVGGRNSNSFPPAWGEGFLFSVPAVFLLFNLNSQPLHHSCIPESGRGLWWQLGPLGRTWGIPTPSSLFRKQSFLCAAARPVSRASSRFLRGSMGRGSQVLLGLGEQACTDRGAYVLSGASSPTPLRLISLLSAMTYLRVNPSHLSQLRAYHPSTASLLLSTAWTKSSNGEGRPWVVGL